MLLVVRPSTEEKIYIDQNLGCSFLRIQDIVDTLCLGQSWKFLEQQLGVKERVVIIFNGPLNPTMRPDSPGMWRTRIAIKAEVPRQKVHLDVKYYFYNSANRSAVLTTVFLRQKMDVPR